MSLWNRFRNTLAEGSTAGDEDEIRFHIESRTAEFMADGMSETEARRRAQLQFGSAANYREQTRDAVIVPGLDAVLRDLRLGARNLARRPGLFAVAAGTLALGIGLVTSVFSVVDAVLLRPLPFPDAAAVFAITETVNGNAVGGNPARFRDYVSQARSFSAMAGFYGESLVMTGAGGAERVRVGRTFGDPLAVLGAKLPVGRAFTPDEAGGLGPPVVILTASYWRQRFGADPGVIGKSLILGGEAFRVIGVLPAEIGYPEGLDALAPAAPGFQGGGREGNWFGIAARLSPGVAMESAQAELDAIATRLAQAYPATDKALTARLAPMVEADTAEASKPLWFLLAVALFVLLIACLNVAGLQLARAAERSREAAIRTSLGASPSALARLYFAESCMIALAGGAGGLLVAAWGTEFLKRTLPAELPRLASVALDERLAVFCAIATIASALVFGAVPALRAHAGVDLLREGRGAVASRPGHHARRLLVIGQTALSVVLLVGAALAAEGFLALRKEPLGYQPAGRIAVSVPYPWGTPAQKVRGFTEQVLEQFQAIPGVRRAGVTDRLPLEGNTQSGAVTIRGLALAPELSRTPVDERIVSSSYFAATGHPLVAGRLVTDRPQPRETVVNEAFVRRFLRGTDPVGRQLAFQRGSAPPEYFEIVGVVGDVRQSLTAPVNPSAFLSPEHGYWPLLEFVLETGGTPGNLAAPVRSAIQRVDPQVVAVSIRTLDDHLSETMAGPKTRTALVAGFAAGALLLAALGLFGLLAADVARRTSEIGVRMALGASSRGVALHFVRRGVALTLAGLAVGLPGAAVLSRIAASSVPGIPPLGWLAPVAAGTVLLAAAVAASALPARRASAVDPAHSLRAN